MISSVLLGVKGLGSITNFTSGIPKAAARAWAAVVNVLLTIDTDGIPASSVITVS
ncbi:MAG: Uncharacterised protein [Chloroflexota bacterium]|nr:hypothetical protein [Dehalococcoidia bacterium]CAI8294801.1 MAG: Uncharacterised protein [Chloroflexota bacterium]